MAGAIKGLGTIFKIKLANAGTMDDDYTSFTDTVSISGPGWSVRNKEIATNGSAVATYLATLPENKEVTVEWFIDPTNANHMRVIGLQTNQPKDGCDAAIVLSDAYQTTLSFKALFTDCDLQGMSPDDVPKITAKFRPNSAIVITNND